MVKDLIEDIKRPKRSLQDILPVTPVSKQYERPVSEPRPERRERPRQRWPLILLFILVVIFAAVYLGSMMFGRALVVVVPRRVPFVVSGTYRALNLPTSAASSTVLGFQTMTIRGSESITVPAGAAVAVAERASGAIVIMNRYSQTAQRLLPNTRFESPAGKIYRSQEAVLVPGYTLIGGILTPGELEVKVTADKPGPDYNHPVSAKDIFTIPGFKGEARFKMITAREKTSFTGGFVGARQAVSPTVQTAATAELVKQLEERLLAEAANQIPDEYVWYPSTAFWRLGGASTTEASAKPEVKLTQQVELVAPIFSRAELSQTLARRFVPTYDGAPVLVENVERLNLRSAGALSDPARLTEFIFTLDGEAVLVWQFDSAALISDLTGRGSSDYQAVFVKYPSIVASQATFRPPWLTRFPTDPKRINLSADKAGLTIETASAKLASTTNQLDTTNGD